MYHIDVRFYQLFIFVLFLNHEIQFVSAVCDLFEWRCDNGDCIPYEDRCDGIKHCADGSDETVDHCIHFTCPAYAFRCAYGACVPGSFICNKRNDCVDGSDETRFLCDRNLRESQIAEILRGNCNTTNAFQCQPGECIHIDKRCDGKLDCSNGADETIEMCSSLPCHKLSFRCGYGACIAGSLRCNNVNDCFDGSDEAVELCENKESMSLCRMPLRRDYLEFFNVNGKKIINAGDIVEYGIELRFKCLEGWHLLGAKRIFCERDGWSNPVPFCTKYCPKYFANRGISTTAQCFLNDQEIRCNGLIPLGTVAQLSCAPGYTLDESAPIPLSTAIRCNNDGKWNAEKLKCTPICGQVHVNSTKEVLPWEVSIFRLEGNVFRKQCMGTIVSHKIVISAEKCFTQMRSPKPDEHEFYNIVTGNLVNDYEPHTYTKERQVFNVSEIVLSSTHSGLRSADHIAILVLVNYFDFSKTLAPICIELKRFTTSPYLQKRNENIFYYASIDFGGGFYKVKESLYFLNAVVGDRNSLKPINLTNFDSIVKKYIKRYYAVL